MITMQEYVQKHPRYAAMVQGAKNYAEGDKSDPFAFSPAMTHTHNGLCFPDKNGESTHYEAKPTVENRTLRREGEPDQEYQVTVMRDMKRP